jgi:predicted enzyme related to lactoylglutathione lyase
MQTQLGYFTLETLDVTQAKAFYSALFGWRFDANASVSTYAHVTASSPAFGFTKVERTDGHANLYFQVDDIDAACSQVTELGGRSAMPSDSPSGRSVTVHDDQGVAFSLWQPAPGYV